jgi:hypothetical protein
MNKNLFTDQEAIFIHMSLVNDAAYNYSVENNDEFNMRIVLRAYGYPCSPEAAETQIRIANEFGVAA